MEEFNSAISEEWSTDGNHLMKVSKIQDGLRSRAYVNQMYKQITGQQHSPQGNRIICKILQSL